MIANEGISCQLMTGWKGQKSKSRRRGPFIKCHEGTRALLSEGGEEKVKPHSALWRAQNLLDRGPRGGWAWWSGKWSRFSGQEPKTWPPGCQIRTRVGRAFPFGWQPSGEGTHKEEGPKVAQVLINWENAQLAGVRATLKTSKIPWLTFLIGWITDRC